LNSAPDEISQDRRRGRRPVGTPEERDETQAVFGPRAPRHREGEPVGDREGDDGGDGLFRMVRLARALTGIVTASPSGGINGLGDWKSTSAGNSTETRKDRTGRIICSRQKRRQRRTSRQGYGGRKWRHRSWCAGARRIDNRQNGYYRFDSTERRAAFGVARAAVPAASRWRASVFVQHDVATAHCIRPYAPRDDDRPIPGRKRTCSGRVDRAASPHDLPTRVASQPVGQRNLAFVKGYKHHGR